MSALQRIESIIYALANFGYKPELHGGYLRVLDQNGLIYEAGDSSGPSFTMKVRSGRTLHKIYTNPDLLLGETYVDKEWDLIQGDLGQFLTWLVHNYRKAFLKIPAANRVNTVQDSRRNVAHHYDMGNDLYQSFLDEGMNYSCAFFDDHRMSLRGAQLNKIYTTLNRIGVEPGMRVLDIGCGWGELCRTLASCVPGAEIRGITLSENQLRWAQKENTAAAHKVDFLLEDYRDHAKTHPESYDRIISIGMFEHVGRAHYATYFKAIADLLKPGGRALVHSIMRPEPGSGTSQWLDTYIFPGGCIPYLPDALSVAGEQGLKTVVPPYRHASRNYAETLRHWRQNYNAHRGTLDPAHYDERFHRLWNFYLACSEAAFDGLGYYVAQTVFEKTAQKTETGPGFWHLKQETSHEI
jgi:cyclopropane-fatty-acyl-phospholipid synthase